MRKKLHTKKKGKYDKAKTERQRLLTTIISSYILFGFG